MRTTIRLDDTLLRSAKKMALESNMSLTKLIEEALREKMARKERPAKTPLSLVTFKGNGLHSGVDLDDSAGLADIMDSHEVV